MSSAESRPTQAERRTRSRNALLEAAARGVARNGFAELSLAAVAAEAGYTRGALYHQFAGKEDLALAVVDWFHQSWQQEVGRLLVVDSADTTDTLITVARRHAIFCRREIAGVLLNLRVEFGQRDHPIARAITDILDTLGKDCATLIRAGRASGDIPAGPPAKITATAYLGALEAITINLAGARPYDVELAERTARGILGLPPAPRRKGSAR